MGHESAPQEQYTDDALDTIEEVESAEAGISQAEARSEITDAGEILEQFGINPEYYFGSDPDEEEVLAMAAAIRMVRTGDPEAQGIVNALVDGATERIAVATQE